MLFMEHNMTVQALELIANINWEKLLLHMSAHCVFLHTQSFDNHENRQFNIYFTFFFGFSDDKVKLKNVDGRDSSTGHCRLKSLH